MTRRREAGFTLLEVLVALTVLGFLVAGLAQGTGFGLQAWSRQDRTIAASSELDAFDRTLRTLLTRLDPTAGVVGTAHTIAFTSALPQAAALRTHEADMAIGVDASHHVILRWTPHEHAERLAAAPPPTEAELLSGIAGLDISYWPMGGSAWQDTWSNREPPAMIRLRVRFPASDPRHWADIVASPMRTLPDH